MSTQFLSKLQLSSQTPLFEADKRGRIQCPQCKKNMKYFCYNCRKSLIPNIPSVTLPIECDIIHHPTEKVSKSTALTATILSEQTNWIEFPSEIPNYNPNDTLLLYPSPNAKKLSEVENLQQYKRIVCIESVWQKAPVVVNHPIIAQLPRVGQ